MPPRQATRLKQTKRQEFPFFLPFDKLDLRQRPDLYRIAKGEQGVLSVEPYKSEILPLWKFKNPQVATESSRAIKQKFEEYKRQQDFVGCDMARKFMQMGYTRARRYANHKGGKKYNVDATTGSKTLIPRLDLADQDPDKAEAARIFAQQLEILNNDEEYHKLRDKHVETYESKELDLEGIDVLDGVPRKRGGEAKGELGKRKRSRKTAE
ncbi:hypothetical protein OIO90_002857 [Microbotryomycetes sp. JL221]|nr:hypothetical protein OIO90_002857 [Microbotryomycetes sp. JL221]